MTQANQFPNPNNPGALFGDIPQAPAQPAPQVPQPQYAPQPQYSPAPPQQPPQAQPPPVPVESPQQQAVQAQVPQEPVYTMTQTQLQEVIDSTVNRVQQNLAQPTIKDQLIPQAPPLNDPEPSGNGADDIGNLMWENPAEFAEAIEKRAVEKVSKQQQAQQEIESFWNNFYTQNPDLNRAQDHGLVSQILSQNMSTMGTLPLSSLIPQLAQMVRAQLSAYATRFTGQPQQPAAPFVGETPNPVPGAGPQPQQVAQLPQPKTLSSLIKQKQAARLAK